jgi:hypothetical protein
MRDWAGAVLVGTLTLAIFFATTTTVFDTAAPYLKLTVYILALVFTVAAFFASLYVMLSTRFSDDLKKAAWGTIGTILGFSIGLLVKL